MLTALEPRRLFSATLSDGILTIAGTAGDDVVFVEAGRKAFFVRLNGQSTMFNTADVRRMRIFGGDGNDNIVVSPKSLIPASVEGGSGNDVLRGGGAADILFGQRGNDALVGMLGNDYLDAGPGDDILNDINGINVTHGGSGTDTAVLSLEARLGTGIEEPLFHTGNDAVTLPGGGMTTDLKRVGDRVILFYNADIGGSTGDYADHSIRRSPGGYEVITEGHTGYAGGATHGQIDAAWDVTRAITRRQILTFTYSEDVQADGKPYFRYSVPFLLPT